MNFILLVYLTITIEKPINKVRPWSIRNYQPIKYIRKIDKACCSTTCTNSSFMVIPKVKMNGLDFMKISADWRLSQHKSPRTDSSDPL
jgi:hypothetical protein